MAGEYSTKDFCVPIQVRWKIRLALIYIFIRQPLENSVHATKHGTTNCSGLMANIRIMVMWLIIHFELQANVFSEVGPCQQSVQVNTLRPRQNGRRFADDTFRHIFLNENVRISIKISMKFVPKGPLDNIPSLVQIMAWRRPGDKPLSGAMMVNLPTHICVTRPQWVNRQEQIYHVTMTSRRGQYWPIGDRICHCRFMTLAMHVNHISSLLYLFFFWVGALLNCNYALRPEMWSFTKNSHPWFILVFELSWSQHV